MSELGVHELMTPVDEWGTPFILERPANLRQDIEERRIEKFLIEHEARRESMLRRQIARDHHRSRWGSLIVAMTELSVVTSASLRHSFESNEVASIVDEYSTSVDAHLDVDFWNAIAVGWALDSGEWRIVDCLPTVVVRHPVVAVEAQL